MSELDFSVLPPAVQQLRDRADREQLVVVLATGVFDILHQEHKHFLEKAKLAGDVLIVGIESDVRVRALKGEGRPIHEQDIRRHNLLAWHIADEVFILPETFDQQSIREALIAKLHPAILAVSSHSPFLEKKRELMERYGGKVVVVHQHNPAVSTSLLLQQV